MTEKVNQAPPQATPKLPPIPRYILSQLAHPPIGPNESAVEFKSLFYELADAFQTGHRTAAEYAMLLQATILTFRTMSLERIRSAIIQHMRPEAVVALIRLTDGVIERNSPADFEVNNRRQTYFANKDGKAKVEAEFARMGYAANAVDVEAFQLALPSLVLIDRQINAAQKQLMAFLKEIDRRDAKRAEDLRKAALGAVSRAGSDAAVKRGTN